MKLGQRSGEELVRVDPARWAHSVADQKNQIAELRAQLQERVDAMAMRIGEVNAHVIRLDALGKRLTEMANIDSREFDFDSAPPSGGPERRRRRQRPDPGYHQHARVASSRRVDLRDCPARRPGERDPRPRAQEADPPGRPPGHRPASFLRISASARTRSPGTRPSTRASISPAPRAQTSWRWPQAS